MKCFLDIIKTHKSYINCFCFSVAQSCVILQSHGLQHARLSCPSLSPGICSNSRSLSWWHHPTILSSVAPFSCPQSFPASQCVGSSHQVAKVLKLQLQHQSFLWIFRVDFLQDWLLWPPAVQGTLQSLLQHHSLKASVLRWSALFMVKIIKTHKSYINKL